MPGQLTRPKDMTTDMSAMHGLGLVAAAASQGQSHSDDMTDAWPSGGSTTSMAMDEHDEHDEHDDAQSDDSHRKYERKTKRFAWPDDLHRLFVAAIFDLGLKNASPKALMPFMQPTATDAGLTTEHLKSHLQKYRLNYDKSRAEFLAFFDESAKRNGKRRRRSAKSAESHTRFIFPIGPSVPAQEAAGQLDAMSPPARLQIKPNGVPVTPLEALPQAHTFVPNSGSLTPRSRLQRAKLLRIAQQNAAMAFTAAGMQGGMLGGYGAGASPGAMGPGEGVSDAQWGILASLLSPQIAAAAANSANGQPPALSLRDEASPDLQLQMHLAMQAQMNLHRQMLTRKVAVSEHYYNQAAAVKRAAASAMVERALQNVATHSQQTPQQQQQLQQYPSGRYSEQSMRPTPTRPSLSEATLLQQQQQQQYQQLSQQQQQQQQQRYAAASMANTYNAPTLSASDALLPAPWDGMDIDMGLSSDDQNDLFSFLKSTE